MSETTRLAVPSRSRARAVTDRHSATMATVKRNTELKKVKFGTTDMMVTQVCAGTMTWGSFNADESQAHAQLDKLWQRGVNFIDTAELYPVAWNYGALTEKWIGNWLTKRIADGTVERSKLYIATKVNPAASVTSIPRAPKRCTDTTRRSEWSCRKPSSAWCGYIDLYQIHWPSRDTPPCPPTFRPADENGKIKIAPWMPRQGRPGRFRQDDQVHHEALRAGPDPPLGRQQRERVRDHHALPGRDTTRCPLPVSCQNDFSILNQTYEEDTWEAAYRFGIVGLPYGTAGGTLRASTSISPTLSTSPRTRPRGRWTVQAQGQLRFSPGRLRAGDGGDARVRRARRAVEHHPHGARDRVEHRQAVQRQRQRHHRNDHGEAG